MPRDNVEGTHSNSDMDACSDIRVCQLSDGGHIAWLVARYGCKAKLPEDHGWFNSEYLAAVAACSLNLQWPKSVIATVQEFTIALPNAQVEPLHTYD